MRRTLSLTLFVLLSAPLFAFSAGQHHHGSAATASHPITLELKDGMKWPTDLPLRKGMSAIREITAATIASAHANKATDATYDDAARRIDREVASIVQNCKLDPAADAQLHVVISEIMASSGVMAGKAPAKPRMDGLHRVAEALDAYGTHFAHAGWKRLDVQHE